MDVTLGEQRLTLANIYGPNEDKNIFLQISWTLLKACQMIIRFGGDFIVILDFELDRTGGSNQAVTNNKAREVIQQWLNDEILVDVWRVRNQEKRVYTWSRRKPVPVCSRLDLFLVSFSLQGFIEKTEIKPGFMTDHSMIMIKLVTNGNKRGPGFWKFNSKLLENEDYIKMVKQTIKDTVQDNPDTDPPLLLETVKCRVRGDTISYAANINKKEKGKIVKLEQKHEQQLSNMQAIEETQKELDLAIEQKAKGAIFRSKVQYFEEGEKASKYYLNLEKRNYNKKVINRLRVGDKIINDPTLILEEEANFYSNLYTPKIQEDLDKTKQFLSPDSNIPKLNNDQSSLCEV